MNGDRFNNSPFEPVIFERTFMSKFWAENKKTIIGLITAAALSVVAWATGLLDGVFGGAPESPPAATAPAELGTVHNSALPPAK